MRWALGFACMFAAAASVSPVAAQDISSPNPLQRAHRSERYSISGVLREAETSRFLPGIRVELRQPGGGTTASTLTSTSGEFTFSGIGSGSYEIAVEEPGYEPYDQQISVEDSVLGLQVWLRKPSDGFSKSATPTVSVRELSIPRKAHEFMQKGLMLLYEKSDYRGSIAQFERAIKEYPTYYEAYAQMGLAYLSMDDSANAEENLRKSIDVSNQHYPDAYVLLAGLYLSKNRMADAEPLARKAADLDQKSWKGHYELGCALYGLDRFEEAEREAQTAAQLQPGDTDVHLLLANVHVRLKKFPVVLDDLDAYLKLDPNGPNADQARRLREQVQTALQKAQAAEADSDADDADDTPDEAGSPDTNAADSPEEPR